MLTTHQFASHLPYLRRFARALSGSQSAGDAQVTAVLEALVADPSLCKTAGRGAGDSARVIIYHTFLTILGSLEPGAEGPALPAGGREAAALRNLEAMTPRARQAFLLKAMEGFSLDEVAAILDTDPIGASRLVDLAGREIADQLATDVLIIEDEPLIALDLASLVKSLGHRVIGKARTYREAVRAALTASPGLVLADIHLADGSSGIDAVNEILASAAVPVVFITAYPERLLTGERPEPAFLINKPYEIETVTAVISQALFFDSRARRCGQFTVAPN